MKYALFFILLIPHLPCFAQCPFEVTLKNKGGICLGNDTLFVTGNTGRITKIDWYNGHTIDTTVNGIVKTDTVSGGVTVAGGGPAGSGNNQISTPNSVCVDANGNIYVADLFNYRILKFPPGSTGGSPGTVAAGGNGQGGGLNQFQPNSVFVDGGGNIFIADNQNDRVMQFPPGSTEATYGTIVAGGNGYGAGANQLNDPVSVCTDASGNIYVVDANNQRIQKFPAGSTKLTQGTTVAGGNGQGSGANQLSGPTGVFVDGRGNIYVSDGGNHRVQKFTPGSLIGKTVAGGNGNGNAANQLSTPSSVFVDGSGNLYVTDPQNERVQKFPPGSTDTSHGITVAGGNGAGTGPNQFNFPFSVYVDANGAIYVADLNNNRIQKFDQHITHQSVSDTTLVPSSPGTYTAVVTDSAGCVVTTNAVVVNPNVTPLVSISATPLYQGVCATQALYNMRFTAMADNGGTAPYYQWKMNGALVPGVNTSIYTAAVANNSYVTCTVTSNAVCATPTTVTSNIYTFKINMPAAPVLSSNGGICLGNGSLVVSGTNSPAKIVWYNGSMAVATVTTPGDTVYIPLKAGAYTAVVTSSAGCVDTTNALTISPTITPILSIAADTTAVCAGKPVNFTASAINAGTAPAYQWLLNGSGTGANTPFYNSFTLINGDAVRCVITGGPGCFTTDTSNSIAITVLPLPAVGTANNISISPGQSVTLNLPVTGNITKYVWQPPYGLNDTTTASPVATPAQTTTYTLLVTATNTCTASGSITVKLAYPISIPSAFTPNGDNKNDVFYVRGGYSGDKIKSFVIFNRGGQKMFEEHNAMPEDPAYGWDGTCNGLQQPPAAYVYMVVIASANGTERMFKGTVVLLR